MPGHFTISDTDGKIREDGEWKDISESQLADDLTFSDLIDPVKIVYGVFFDRSGHGDVWVEFTFGHAEAIEEPIRLDSLTLGSNNENIDIEFARTHFARDKETEPYLWDEADTLDEVAGGSSVASSTADRLGEWRSMYEDYVEFDSNERIFACNVGSERILNTPVRYDPPTRIEDNRGEKSELAGLWRIHNFRTLSGNTPVLYPTEDLGEKTKGDAISLDQDCVTLWVKWKDTNLTVPNDDISFHFRFAFHSEIGDIRHSYPYYVLPPGASLMQSLSDQAVTEFYPKNTHWMFLQWVENYAIDRAGTGRMTRSKVKDTDYVFNSGVFGFSTRSPKNMSLRFLYAVLGGGILSGLILSPRSIWELILSVAGILLLTILVYLTFLPRSTPIVRLMGSIESHVLRMWDWMYRS
jgi:hypothetical protein